MIPPNMIMLVPTVAAVCPYYTKGKIQRAEIEDVDQSLGRVSGLDTSEAHNMPGTVTAAGYTAIHAVVLTRNSYELKRLLQLCIRLISLSLTGYGQDLVQIRLVG